MYSITQSAPIRIPEYHTLLQLLYRLLKYRAVAEMLELFHLLLTSITITESYSFERWNISGTSLVYDGTGFQVASLKPKCCTLYPRLFIYKSCMSILINLPSSSPTLIVKRILFLTFIHSKGPTFSPISSRASIILSISSFAANV